MIIRLIETIKYKRECIRSKKRKRQEQKDTYNSISYDTKRRIINVVSGVMCIGVGVWTWYIPFTTMPLIALGLFLIACPFSMWSLLKGLGSDIRYYVGVRL